MSWKRMKGMIKSVNRCPKCRGLLPDEDYDFDEDMCLNCLFPQSAKHMITPINKDFGFDRNITSERELLDNLEYIPEVQSEAAKRSKEAFDRKNYK